MIRAIAIGGAAAAAALLLVATSVGGNSAAPALRGVVGPAFTIKLMKAGKVVKSLKAGTYKVTVSDRSTAHNFVLQRRGGAARELTTVPFVGTKTVTVKLSRGLWTFFCAPHASMMVGRVAVGGATLARAASTVTTTTTTVADDRGGRGELEPGDDRGGHGEPEPGDDHGGHSGHGGGDDD
ncbi:MAG: plastocyanin/azurin family copper-binding protein [Gaiellaceae bacterium]